MKYMNLKLTMKFQLPSIPNFIVSDDGKFSVSIREISVEELEKIGKEWTAELIRKSRKKDL